MFRRGLLCRTTPIGEAGRLPLRRINQLKDAGEYLQAAEIFERVAERMENRLRMLQEVNRLGYASQAAELRGWLEQTAPTPPEYLPDIEADLSAKKSYLRLPAKCPFFGASLRSDLAQWIDETSAVCPYCGSTVQAE
jgi:hypothetical protein